MLNLPNQTRALVTGANGFIGSHLAESLLKASCAVRCLVRKTSVLSWIEDFDVELAYGDLDDPASLERAVEGVDWIFHLAGKTKALSRDEFFKANAAGTENLFRAAEKSAAGLKRFVYVSSLAATGPGPDGRAIRESDPPHPITWYGESKLEGERIALRYGERIPVTIVRPPPVFGPRDGDVLQFFKAVRRGIIPSVGRRDSRASFLYVEDLVDGLNRAARADAAAGKTYFLASADCMEWRDFGAKAAAAMGRRAVFIPIPYWALAAVVHVREAVTALTGKPSILNRQKLPEYRQPYWCCDASKAGNELGFRPSCTIDEAIRRTVDWYRDQGWL
jgi:dihydroflavonol-4-reductase